MNFTKLQGAGNDFVLVEAENTKRDWSKATIAMCDRHLGIGADGLLLLLPSQKADFRMRMFNPDGSEAEACGNGLRCLARYVHDRKLVQPETKEILIETLAGNRTARCHYNGNETAIQVSMGRPKLAAKDIPVLVDENGSLNADSVFDYPLTVAGRKLKLAFVSMGNPHAIYFSQKPVAEFPLDRIGPKIEHHRIFPRRINFEVARPISDELIEVRVWERGAGETLACGTGACAVAVAAQLLGYTCKSVNIKLAGGTLNVEWDRGGEVFLGGPAKIVFNGEWIEE